MSERRASYDILVYGPLFCDLIFTGLPDLPTLGTELFARDMTVALGGSAIVAAWLHQLGARVGLIAELGNDALSHAMRALLDEAGLDRTLIRNHPFSLPQTTVALSFPTERAFVTRFARPPTPPDLDTLLSAHPAKHLHVSSFLAVEETPNVCGIARAAGLTVSFDPGWDEAALRSSELAAAIAEVDFFLPNRSELCHIAQTDQVDAAAAHVGANMAHGMIVLKEGAAGATAYDRHGAAVARVPALAVSPIDTTGAGDAFDAGFLYAYSNGRPLDLCLQYGAVCGSLATTTVGGAAAGRSMQEVELWRQKLPL